MIREKGNGRARCEDICEEKIRASCQLLPFRERKNKGTSE